MEFIIEVLCEVLFEGAFELAADKEVPLTVRAIAGIVILAVFGGISGLCIYWGIKKSLTVLIVIGVAILLLPVIVFLAKRKRK